MRTLVSSVLVSATLAAIAVFTLNAHAFADEQPPALFSAAAASRAQEMQRGTESTARGMHVLKRRLVTVNSQLLVPKSSQLAKQLTLELFDARTLTVMRVQAHLDPDGGFTWRGRVLEHGEGSRVTFVASGSISGPISGAITLPDASPGVRDFVLTPADARTAWLEEIDTRHQPGDPDLANDLPPPSHPPR